MELEELSVTLNGNFVNTTKRCLKKAEHMKKNFISYNVILKKFVDYKTTNESQLCNFP